VALTELVADAGYPVGMAAHLPDVEHDVGSQSHVELGEPLAVARRRHLHHSAAHRETSKSDQRSAMKVEII
jgi:hypothetical protein